MVQQRNLCHYARLCRVAAFELADWASCGLWDGTVMTGALRKTETGYEAAHYPGLGAFLHAFVDGQKHSIQRSGGNSVDRPSPQTARRIRKLK